MRFNWWAGALLLAASLYLSGCIEKVTTVGGGFTVTPGSGGVFDPNKVPRLIACTPNVGPESGTTDFFIEGQNLLPLTPVVVTFGSLQFNGETNSLGTRITNPSSGTGMFTAPGGTGSVDVEVFITGQNPPYLTLPNGFTYLPPGAPPLPAALTMTPNTDTEFGGTTMNLTGQNVPVGTYQIIVSFQFSTGTVNVAGVQTVPDAWSCTIPPVPILENFQSGTLQVSVIVYFSDQGMPPLIPTPVASAPPQGATGNPFTYTHTGTPPSPPPEEYLIVSGVQGSSIANAPDSFIRTIRKYDPAYNRINTVTGLAGRYMYNGATLFGPGGTHHYPSPMMVGDVSFRDANSTFAHFTLPSFTRTYEPAVPDGDPPAAPVNKAVTGKLFHVTSTESGTTGASATGLQDAFFAAYSNGQVEVFDTGGQPIHEEICIHEHFGTFPYFAVAHDNATPRIFVARCDGQPWVASATNTSELNLSAVTGTLKPLSLQFAGNFLYFATSTGNVYRCPVDSGMAGVAPQAVAQTWPGGLTHSYVSDELNLSGDGTTICFIAGDGNLRFNTATQNPPAYSTHNVFAIRNAHNGNPNIIAVTDFGASPGGPKQIVMWDLGGNSTYGSANVDNGANDRRIYMAGINSFATATNLPGADVVVNYDGELCAFVTREDRNVVDGTTPAFVVYYIYVARIGLGTNQCARLNSFTAGSFGIGSVFHNDMTVVPGLWFPKVVPNAGMRNRLVFSVASVSGAGVTGQVQHIFTANITLTGSGIATPIINNRTDSGASQPFNSASSAVTGNYFGAFPSRQGHVLFLINANNADLLYLDLRDGVTSAIEPVRRSHDNAAMKLPRNDTAGSPLQNTYMPPGFAPDPAGAVNLEHWGNSLRTLHGPGLSAFTSEYLMFVAEESAGAEDLYVLQMNSLSSPLPSKAINVTNISGAGVIKVVEPSRDGAVLAVVKGTTGFAEGYRFSGAAGGTLYVVNDVIQALADNETGLTVSAQSVTTTGNKIGRGMGWYQNSNRYTLYFGEGSSAFTGTPIASAKSYLRFHRLDLDRTQGNLIGTPLRIDTIGGTSLDDGAVYIYNVGKQE
ncbi:MAG: hypothetical protein KF696_04425 [Planctomycetes bacterium]|nr:hypothetical protein [Planctomycetota bacterium]MCW8134219.1 hypothetical protein [Planctomycetota bacterium]